MTETEPSDGAVHSLRGRYLLSSALIGILLLGVSIGAYQHISHVTRANSQALQLTDKLELTLSRIRDAVRAIDQAINSQVLAPSTQTPDDALHAQTSAALQAIHGLMQEVDFQGPAWRTDLQELQRLLTDMQTRLERFHTLRQDINWIYPALPYIRDTMLNEHIGVEQELALALEETSQSLEQPGQLEIFRSLSELRDLWRRMLLNFRAAMIRFAGLPGTDVIAEEHNIEQIYSVLTERLGWLHDGDHGLPLGFQTEVSLENMRRHAQRWHGYFQEMKKLRTTGTWRGDVRFIEEQLRPVQLELERVMSRLAEHARAWSGATTQAVGSAAERINQLLWLLSLIGLVVIGLLYFLLDRSVLTPIARVANALAAEARGQNSITLPRQRNREIAKLIDAFVHMRRLIQGRQQALEFQAVHDVLTGLPNRALLQDRLVQALATTARHRSQLAVLLLDLDHFKEINDTLGHQVGDKVLQEVGQRLLTLLREGDTVARLGGDEFALVLPGMNRNSATALAKQIQQTLAESFAVAGRSLYIGASIGIVTAPDEGLDASTLIRRADNAMYSAKRAQSGFAYYDPKQDEETAESLSLAHQLREVLQTLDGLQLYYQPRFDPGSRRIVGAEALLRWRMPNGEWASPERMVQVAEHANMIHELTSWVLNQAIADCARCRKTDPALTVSVNLSARDLLDETLPERVADILQRHRVPAENLILEITENAVLVSPDRARRLLERLAEQGITLSIDDFGTGFSSLAHLKLLPVHELKIDKSFVLNMRDSDNDAVIVYSTIDLGHNLGLKVVAEGVENEQTLELLRARHCDLIQGYLISRPVPLAQMLDLAGQAQARAPSAFNPAGAR